MRVQPKQEQQQKHKETNLCRVIRIYGNALRFFGFRFITAQKRSCGKVMFSQVSVILLGGVPM